MQYTKIAQTTQYVVGDLLYVVHGHGGNEEEYGGVGMVFRKDLRRHITGFQLSHKGNILVAGLDLAPRRLSVVSAYVPHSRRPEEERVAMFNELSKVIGQCQKKGATIILGDFNSRIHGRLRGEEDVLGPHLYGYGAEVAANPMWEQGADQTGSCSWKCATRTA